MYVSSTYSLLAREGRMPVGSDQRRRGGAGIIRTGLAREECAVRFGLQVPRFTWPGGAREIGSRLRNIAESAEAAGFYSVWVMDHFFQIRGVGQADEPMLECYTTLGHLAAVTDRLRLGALVTGVIYREPALLVKEVTTLDVLSRGRAYFGIGAAWFEREARGLGVEFPTVAERFERLEETLQITKQMWSDDVGEYSGRYYQLAETLNRPQPLQNPHPPIMIGGMGEKKTLRMVAQYAQASNLFMRAGVDTLRNKLKVLQGHCNDLGRDYDEIEVTALGTYEPTDEGTREALELSWQLADLGFDQLIFNMKDVHEPATIGRFHDGVLAQFE